VRRSTKNSKRKSVSTKSHEKKVLKRKLNVRLKKPNEKSKAKLSLNNWTKFDRVKINQCKKDKLLRKYLKKTKLKRKSE